MKENSFAFAYFSSENHHEVQNHSFSTFSRTIESYLYKVYKVSLQASEYRKKQHHNWQIDKNIDKIQKFEK